MIFSHFVLQRDIRLDAALKAMHPFGFPDDLVQVTVRELLNVDAALKAMHPFGFPEDLVQVTVRELLNVGLFLFLFSLFFFESKK